MRRIAIFIDSDSQYFGTKGISQYFMDVGWGVEYIIPKHTTIPLKLKEEISKTSRVVYSNLDEFSLSEGVIGYDAVGVYSTGSQIRRFQRNISYLYETKSQRPYIFTGYNGVVYEKYEEGIFWRCGYDCICVNGQRDIDLFSAILASTYAKDQKLIPLGINKPNFPSDKKFRNNSIVFAEQVKVPETLISREKLFESLANFAKANTGWEIIIKPRVPIGSQTFHKEILHPEKYGKWPNNVRISHASLQELMKSSRALLSISSTAFFDALAFGITPLCILDFGAQRNHGTHFFVGCGTEIFLRDCVPIETILERKVSSRWLARTGYNLNGYHHLKSEIETWVEGPLPPSFPDTILNTTKSARSRALLTPEKIVLFEVTENLYKSKRYEELESLIQRKRESLSSDPNSAYLVSDFYEEIGEFRKALEWLSYVRKLKPHWKKSKRKAVRLVWKVIVGRAKKKS